MANDMRYLSAEEEAKLLKPIDEYVGKIQAQIDALRVDGSDQVQALKTHISLTKEDKNYTKEDQNAIIRKDQALLVKAREVENANKDKVSKLIADAESYLKTHFKKDYYDKVAASCAAQKEAENAEYAKVREKLKAEHERTISGMTDKQELKDEKYVYKNRLYDAQMVHESKLQEIKDRKHEAFVHQYHLIDLLRMSKFTYGQKKLQKLENYKYPSVSYEIAEQIQEKSGMEVRVTVPGHTQRGGSPCAYDRVFASRLGSEAGRMILAGEYGFMVGYKHREIVKVPLEEVAGKLKMLDPNASIVREAKMMGISFGD